MQEVATKLQELLGDSLNSGSVLMDYACGPGLVSFGMLDQVKRIGEIDPTESLRTELKST